MKFKRNLLILTVILIGILIVIPGCLSTTPPTEEGDVPTNGTISVAAAAVTTNDTTPPLTMSSTGATYMAFSGNGTTWSSWVTYATTYSAFNITTGEGCTSGDGTKTVYVKFKNDDGESTKVYDSIILDTVKPTLSTAVYTDVGSGGTVNASDTVVFTFDDEMDITTVTASTVKANLLLSASKSYGTSPTVSWDSTLKICTVTLGASPTLIVGTTTVNPSVLVKDTAGNTDNSTAVTISTTTTVLSSVSISNSAVETTTGGSTITLTAVATSTASTVMTSSCTFTWSLYSGVGSISTGTTSTATYTPPESGTGPAVVKVSVIKTGTTTPVKTATASTITVSAATTASAALTGTVISGAPITETNIVDGTKTIILTLTNDTWIAATGTGSYYLIADANTIIDGLVAATDTTEWAKVITALKSANNGTDNTAVVRTSATVLTITLPATAGYDIAANQTVTMTVPAASVAGTAAIVAAPTFVITADVASAALTGTIISGAPITETNIVDGTKTIILTLTNDTWIAGTGVGGVNYAFADANTIIDGLTTATDTTEWDKVIIALKSENNGTDNTAVVRTSATVLTITLPATVGYNISASQNQTVTMTVPAASVAGTAAIVAAPTFVITADVASAALTGTIISGAPITETNIVDGTKTIILTLTNDTWIAGTGVGGVNYAVADANTIIDGLTTATDTTEWAKVITALKSANNGTDNTAVVRTSATVLTITLPATAGYDIAANQTVTMNVPVASVAGTAAIVAAPTFVITAD